VSDYYTDPRLSASKLKAYLQHDSVIAHHMETNPSTSTSDALRYGTALHALMEGQSVTVSPHDAFRTKEAKAWKAENPDFLKAEEFAMVEAWHNSVIDTLMTKHERLYNAYKSGEYEKEFFTDTHKAKLDCIHDGIVLDWKSCVQTERSQIVRSAWNYNWALQAYIYKWISGASEFHFICVSKTAPHPVFVLSCTDELFAHGKRLFDKAMKAREDFLLGSSEPEVNFDAPPWGSQGSDEDEKVDW